MIKHLLKLVWNRKRTNFLVMVEIFFSFLVLFAVVLLGVYYTDNYRRPLGFSYDRVWRVGIDVKQQSDDYWSPEQAETTRQLFLAAREFGEVEAAAGTLSVPYSVGGSFGGMESNGHELRFERGEVTDDFQQVMGLELVRGRWFGKDDDGANYQPVVVNERMARALFGEADPVGRSLRLDAEQEERVVGVVSDFRKGGEFSSPDNFVFYRRDLNNPKERPPRNLLLKLRPGTPRAFEERLNARLQAVAKEWSFEIEPLAEMRESSLRLRLAPILAAGLVAGFLMIMVALGLTGVLWQNVTQRTKEIGLRRAKGATARHIYTQILGELLVIASFGLVIGVAIVVQFPLLDVIGFISGQVYFYSLLISLALIYLLTVACGLYPSWLATKVQPAEALHYE